MVAESRLDVVEDALIALRGYIARPPQGGHVVLLFSGGIDSVVAAAQLAETRAGRLHLLFVNRSQTNLVGELESARYYADLLREKYGDGVPALSVVTSSIPSPELRLSIQPYSQAYGYPCRDNLFALAGMEYLVSLPPDGLSKRHVYLASLDEDRYPHCSLLALRATTLTACVSTPFDDWCVTSPHADQLIAPFGVQTKASVISWARDRGIPLARTRTCQSGLLENCGACELCLKRQAAFQKAGVADDTAYANEPVDL